MNRTLASALLVFFLGCGGTSATGQVQKGITAYADGAYPSAVRALSHVDEDKLNDRGRVRLFVYRGLARLQLGDTAGAAPDLTEGKRLYASGDPRWLPATTVRQLDDAISQLGGGGAANSPNAPSSPPSPSSTSAGTASPASTGPQYLPPQPR